MAKIIQFGIGSFKLGPSLVQAQVNNSFNGLSGKLKQLSILIWPERSGGWYIPPTPQPHEKVIKSIKATTTADRLVSTT